VSIALVAIRAVTAVNTARFAFPIFTKFTLKIVRRIVNITDTVLTVSIPSTVRSNASIVTTLVPSHAVRVNITSTPMRLSISSTDWFVLRTLSIIRTTWFTDMISIAIVARIVRPRLITCVRRTVTVAVTTFVWLWNAFMGPGVTQLILCAVFVSITATEVRSSTMSADGIAGGAQAVIWAAWHTTIRVGITVFTCGVGVGWRVAHIVLAVTVCSAG